MRVLNRAMAVHVAILKPPYVRAILRGEKTVECRLSRKPVPPFGKVQAGERLFIKHAGGSFAATALVERVDEFSGLTPYDVDRLRAEYDGAIRGDAEYWQKKRGCRFGSLIHLRAVEPLDVGPPYAKSPYKGWFVLDDTRSPLWELPLTAGALRNSYLRLPGASPAMRQHGFVLELPDGATIDTRLKHGSLVQWRGWRRYYQRHGLEPGDRVRLVATAPGRYRVTFHRQMS